MKKLIFTIMAIGTLSYANAQAQDNAEPDKVSLKLVDTNEEESELIHAFRESMDEYFNAPKAPRFLLYDQKHKIAFGVGGTVRVRTAYDFNGAPTNTFGFIPNSIPVPKDPLSKNNFTIDPYKSSLFFKLMGDNDKLGKFQAFISGQFTGASGEGSTFVLNDAYIKLRGFTLGRTWSVFNDMGAVPPTIDFQGPNGAAEMRTSQIRYTTNLTDNLSMAVSIEKQQTTGTYIAVDSVESTTQRIPDIPMYIQYNWGNGGASHVRFAAVLRNIDYRNTVENKTKTATGYGVQLSTNTVFSPVVEFYGQVSYGKGIAQYINDLAGNGLSLVPDANTPGKMKPLEALGWFAQMQFNLSESVFTTVGYSQAKVFPKGDVETFNNYRYGQYVVGNIFYNIGAFQLGLEYLWGNRVNIGGEKGSANCIQTLVQFNF